MKKCIIVASLLTLLNIFIQPMNEDENVVEITTNERKDEKNITENKSPQITIVDTNDVYKDKKYEIDAGLATKFSVIKNMFDDENINRLEEDAEIPLDGQGTDIGKYFDFVANWLKDPEKTKISNNNIAPYIIFTDYLGNLKLTETENLIDWLAKIFLSQFPNINTNTTKEEWEKIINEIPKIPQNILTYHIIPQLQLTNATLLIGFGAKILTDHKSDLQCLIKFDENTFISGDENGLINLWDLESGTVKKTYKSGKGVRCLLKFDETSFISGHDDGTICIWNINKTKSAKKKKIHDAGITTIIKIDNTTIATCSKDRTIKIVNITTLDTIYTLLEKGLRAECNIICIPHKTTIDEKVKAGNKIIYGGIANVKAWNLLKEEYPEIEEALTEELVPMEISNDIAPKHSPGAIVANRLVVVEDKNILVLSYKNEILYIDTEQKKSYPKNFVITKNLELNYITKLSDDAILISEDDMGGKQNITINTIDGELKMKIETYGISYKGNVSTIFEQNPNCLIAILNRDKIVMYDLELIKKFENIEQIILVKFLSNYYKNNKTLPNLDIQYTYLKEIYQTLDIKIKKAFVCMLGNSKNYLTNIEFYKKEIEEENEKTEKCIIS